MACSASLKHPESKAVCRCLMAKPLRLRKMAVYPIRYDLIGLGLAPNPLVSLFFSESFRKVRRTSPSSANLSNHSKAIFEITDFASETAGPTYFPAGSIYQILVLGNSG